MNRDEIVKWTEENLNSRDFQFDNIDNKLNRNPKLCGMIKLESLCLTEDKYRLQQGYVVVFYGDNIKNMEPITEEILTYLLCCGFYFDWETESFCVNT